MPLDKSGSDSSVSRNISTLSHEGYPHRQAIAIALDVARRNRADGGAAFKPPNMSPSWQMRQEARGMHTGPILSAVAGRTDHHSMSVPGGSYVLPADHVSSLGQGNSMSGAAVISHMFGPAGPYGIGKAPSMARGHGAPSPPRPAKFARGGKVETVGEPVPIMAAGGEYVLSPEQVMRVGHGNLEAGHKILDKWVLANRKKHVQTLSKLPGPAKD